MKRTKIRTFTPTATLSLAVVLPIGLFLAGAGERCHASEPAGIPQARELSIKPTKTTVTKSYVAEMETKPGEWEAVSEFFYNQDIAAERERSALQYGAAYGCRIRRVHVIGDGVFTREESRLIFTSNKPRPVSLTPLEWSRVLEALDADPECRATAASIRRQVGLSE